MSMVAVKVSCLCIFTKFISVSIKLSNIIHIIPKLAPAMQLRL